MDKKLIGLLLVLGAVAIGLFQAQPETNDAWEDFKKQHNKFYMTAEVEMYRKGIFMENAAKVETHNANPRNTYTMAVNMFTDLTQEEFAEIYLGATVPRSALKLGHEMTTLTQEIEDVDWVALGKVSQVKNQGSCGSCWAFSATGALESAFLLSNINVLLSEQQLVDCSSSYGNQGCNGGWMDSAFQYIKDQGIKTEAEYPYVARTQSCQSNTGGYSLNGYQDVSGCDALLNALSARPVSVAVDAGNWSSYGSGIFGNCGTAINHGVLLVGVTSSYWKIKNSWGGSWGESGYIRLSVGNTCAVCSYPSYPY